jgi:hypothetical protein
VSADYTFRVKGRLTPRLLAALDPLEASGTATDTLLLGRVTDRAALHGIIARIEALGLELVELQRLPPRLGNDCCPECNRNVRPSGQDTRATGAMPRI